MYSSQVKGLSVEQEKLVTQQHLSSSDSRVDSPSSSRGSGSGGGGGGVGGVGSGGVKLNKSLNQGNAGSGISGKLEETNGGRSSHCGGGSESSESMLPPLSPASANSSFTSSYHAAAVAHHKAQQQHYEQQRSSLALQQLPSGYDVRKRHPRSPSDAMRDSHVRASVLRDGSKPERESPLPIGYSPTPSSSSTSAHHYDPLPPSIPPPVISVGGENSAAAGLYEPRLIKVEKSPSPQPWHSNSNCAEGQYNYLQFLKFSASDSCKVVFDFCTVLFYIMATKSIIRKMLYF